MVTDIDPIGSYSQQENSKLQRVVLCKVQVQPITTDNRIQHMIMRLGHLQ